MTETRHVLTEYWKPIITGESEQKTLQWVFQSLCDLHGLSLPLRPDRLLKAYIRDPAFFFVHALHAVPWVCLEHPGRDQLGIIEASTKYDRIAVRSGHKVSKSHTVVGLALNWFCTRDKARVPMTSSSFPQVRQILWYELKNIYRAAQQRGFDIGGELHEDPMTGLTLPDGRQIFGFSTKQPERAAGISGKNIFYMPDEASGIMETIFEAIEGNRAGGAKLLMTSNPTRTQGYFYEAFHSKRMFWNCIHIPSWHSPNCQAGRIVIPGLATPEWVEEKRLEWGEESPLFQVRVAGDFPDQSAYAVFPIHLIEKCVEWGKYLRALDSSPSGELSIGVDPSGSGEDPWVIQPVRGHTAFEPVSETVGSGEIIAHRIIETVEKYIRPTDEIVRINVEAIGEGWATITALRSMNDLKRRELRIRVIPVVVSERATKEDKYANRRTEAAFQLKAWMEHDDAALPDHNRLQAELASCNYVPFSDRRSTYMLVSKDREKEELKRSPNFRDALAMATYKFSNYNVGEFRTTGRRKSYKTSSKFLGY